MLAAVSPNSARSGASVPFLPGNATFVAKDRHHKDQTLNYGPGGAMDNINIKKAMQEPGVGEMPKLNFSVLQTLQDPHFRSNISTRSHTHDQREAIKESARNTYRPGIPPAWLKHDRQVLRFFAHFQEPVHESPKETFRVRQCVLQFYLEDGTMFITEPKVENSGIPQGAFVKRHRIPKPPPSRGYYTPEDLKVGTTISVYSRSFRITDCDDFTRAFYASALQADVGPEEEAPLDAFRIERLQDSARRAAPITRDIAENKEYNELALGGSRRNAKLQQYLENDRKVLCFKALWDDPTRYGARMYYTVHYYLSDDSVEVNENLARNSGRDPYPVFWRRAPLRKNPHVSPAPGMLEPEPMLYKPEDFEVGQTVLVYGRELFLYECDDFTRDFYVQYLDYEQARVEIKEVQPVLAQLENPPHTGFGAEDDSLASCLHLTPRPPRRDINKLMTDADRVLRFEGQLVCGAEEDDTRRFVVAVYLADGSVGVWEKRQRNSGHTEGKFASKSKRKNPATGEWFQPNDFWIGGTVQINGTPFHLVRADEGTLKHMELNAAEFPVADAARIAAKLLQAAPEIAESLSNVGEGSIALDQLQAFVASLGFALAPHELLSLQRAFGSAEQPDSFFPARLIASTAARGNARRK